MAKFLKAWECLKWRVTNDHEKIFEAILRAAQHCCGSQGVALRVARDLWRFRLITPAPLVRG